MACDSGAVKMIIRQTKFDEGLHHPRKHGLAETPAKKVILQMVVEHGGVADRAQAQGGGGRRHHARKPGGRGRTFRRGRRIDLEALAPARSASAASLRGRPEIPAGGLGRRAERGETDLKFFPVGLLQVLVGDAPGSRAQSLAKASPTLGRVQRLKVALADEKGLDEGDRALDLRTQRFGSLFAQHIVRILAPFNEGESEAPVGLEQRERPIHGA